jgi:hypothetical protein
MRYTVFLAWFTFAIFAQTQGGSIAGTVYDSSGASVAEAPVQARNVQSGAVSKAMASAEGHYAMTNLPAGTYQISVSVPGLQPYNGKNLTVEPARIAKLDIRLEDTSQLSTLGEDRLALAASAKRHKPPSGPTPRTKEGKPDLSGVWWQPVTVEPGKPDFLPWAQAVAKQRGENNRKDSPQSRCLPAAVLRLGPIYQFVQSQDYLIEISDDDSPGFHQIYLDGRAHPADPNPSWYGHNIGRWDGDTLVVDRIGFNNLVWLDQEAHPHTEKLHVIERYRRPDLGHMETETTVEDPGTIARPYTIKRVSELAPSEEIYEFICPENNRDISHIVGK